MIQVGIILLLCTGAFAQFNGFTWCPDREAVHNFNLTQYMGTWFEIERYVSFPTWTYKCMSCRYVPNSDGSLQIFHRLINLETNNIVKYNGDATFAGNENEAKFFVDYPKSKNTKHYILSTDYDTYSVVFSCADPTVSDFKNYWILTRKRNPPQSVLKKALQVLDKNKLDKSSLVKTDQKNCPSKVYEYK